MFSGRYSLHIQDFPKILHGSSYCRSRILHFLRKWFSFWFWRLRTRPMQMRGFRVFPKWNRNVTNPRWSRIILRSFWPPLFSTSKIKMGPQTPPDPKTRISTDFPGFPTGNLPFFALFWEQFSNTDLLAAFDGDVYRPVLWARGRNWAYLLPKCIA